MTSVPKFAVTFRLSQQKDSIQTVVDNLCTIPDLTCAVVIVYIRGQASPLLVVQKLYMIAALNFAVGVGFTQKEDYFRLVAAENSGTMLTAVFAAPVT